MSELPAELTRVIAEMQRDGWTGSLTNHMVQGDVRAYDQRRSGRIEKPAVLTREPVRA